MKRPNRKSNNDIVDYVVSQKCWQVVQVTRHREPGFNALFGTFPLTISKAYDDVTEFRTSLHILSKLNGSGVAPQDEHFAGVSAMDSQEREHASHGESACNSSQADHQPEPQRKSQGYHSYVETLRDEKKDQCGQ